MSLLYGQLDKMDSSLDTLQAEMSDIAETDELWTADDEQPVSLTDVDFLGRNFQCGIYCIGKALICKMLSV